MLSFLIINDGYVCIGNTRDLAAQGPVFSVIGAFSYWGCFLFVVPLRLRRIGCCFSWVALTTRRDQQPEQSNTAAIALESFAME